MASDAEAPAVVEIVDDNAPAPEAGQESAPEADVPAQAPETAAAKKEATHKYSKAEKKARKAILKLGLKEIPNVFRVTLKRSPNVCFPASSFPPSLHPSILPRVTRRRRRRGEKNDVLQSHLFLISLSLTWYLSSETSLFSVCFASQIVISRPEVFKSPTSDLYVIFGEVCLCFIA